MKTDELSELFRDAMDWGRTYGQRLNNSYQLLDEVAEQFAYKARAIEAALKEREGEPSISTEHGPWKASTYVGEEGEQYCTRCMLRDKFLGSRKCTPHTVFTAPPKEQPMSEAAASVLAERQRQISVEGWTPEHDDTHNSCELPAAAACYALCATEQHTEELQINGVRVWPWSRAWWKPKTYRDNLVKAGALILAEIERIDRAAERHHNITGE